MIASIVPSLANGQHVGAIVMSNAEVVPVFEMVVFVAGLLVVIQESSGLS